MSIQQTVHIETNEWRRPHFHGRFRLPEALDIDPNRAKAVALFRYRGMEREAQLVLHLANVERLIHTVDVVFEGLDSMAENETEIQNLHIAGSVRDCSLTPKEGDASGTMPKQINLVETVLERALTRLRRAAASSSPPAGAS